MIGTRLAHYEITAHLGSGGMGDVYQATDTKLSRSVAIKFLPDAFSHETERVARFQREARVLALLNQPGMKTAHPHVADAIEICSNERVGMLDLMQVNIYCQAPEGPAKNCNLDEVRHACCRVINAALRAATGSLIV